MVASHHSLTQGSLSSQPHTRKLHLLVLHSCASLSSFLIRFDNCQLAAAVVVISVQLYFTALVSIHANFIPTLITIHTAIPLAMTYSTCSQSYLLYNTSWHSKQFQHLQNHPAAVMPFLYLSKNRFIHLSNIFHKFHTLALAVQYYEAAVCIASVICTWSLARMPFDVTGDVKHHSS